MSSQDYFATAFIRVKPDPKGFRAELRSSIQRAIGKTPYKFPVQPDLVAFRGKLNRQLRQAPLKIPVQPDVTGFKAAVREKLRGFTIPVKVVPIGLTEKQFLGAAGVGRGGAAGGAAGGGAGVTPAETARLKIQQQLANATRINTEAMQQQAGTAARVAELDQVLATLDRQIAQNKTLATNAIVAATGAQEAENRALERAVAAENDRLITLRETVATQRAADQAVVEHAALVEADTAAQQAANEALLVEVSGLDKSSEVRAVRNDLLAADKLLTSAIAQSEKLLGTAYENEAVAIRAANVALKTKIGLELANADAQLASIKSASATATQLGRVGKGASSTALGLLGLRGAILAANPEFLAAAAATIAFAKAVGFAANLQQQLNVFQVTAKATAEQMAAVREEAVALGEDIRLPAVSAADAATAMTELSKAGLSVQDSMDGARGVLELATAAQIDNAQATDLVASALNAFGLAGTDAVRVADLLANASIDAQGGITDMGQALENSAAVARIAGLNIDETVSLITLLAKSGRQGAEAGTTLRNAFLRLLNPSEKAREVLKNLRLESGETVRVLDSSGRLNINIFRQIEEATNRLNAAERKRDLGIIFGTRAIVAQGILGRVTNQQLQDQIDSVNQAGAAQELAGAQTAGFSGKIEALKNSLETLGVVFGDITLGPIGSFLESMTAISGAVTGVISTIQKIPGASDFEKLLGTALFKGPGIFAIEGIAKAFGDTALSADKARIQVNDLLGSLQRAQTLPFGTGAPTVALNETVVGLKKIIAELEKGDPAAQQLARDLQRIVDQLQAGAKVPELRIPTTLTLVGGAADPLQLLQDEADRLRDKFTSLGPQAAAGLGPLAKTTGDVSAAVETAAQKVDRLITNLQKGGGTAESFNQAADAIERISSGLDRSDPKAAELQNALIGVTNTLRGLAITAPSVGDQIAGGLAGGFKGGLPAELPGMVQAGNDLIDGLAEGMKQHARDKGDEVGVEFASGVSAALAIAEATGDEASTLALLRRKRARDQARLNALLGEAGLPAGATPEQVQAQVDAGKITQEQANKIRKAAEAVSKSDDEIDTILGSQQQAKEDAARKAKQRRDKIIQAQNERDQAIIDSFAAAESRATLNEAHIEGTKKLSDDIALSNFLIGLYRRERQEAEKQIRVEKTRTEVVRDLTKKINDEREKRRQLLAQQAQAERERKAAARERREEILAINVEIAQTSGNIAKQKKALIAEIKFFEAQLRLFPKGSLQRKQYILKLRQAQKEYEDIAKAEKDKRDAFRDMAFEFLTTQQGFAATLLGNLLPGVAVAGVGGASPPRIGPAVSTGPETTAGTFAQPKIGTGLTSHPGKTIAEAAQKAAAKERGPSHVQQTRMIGLLTQIVHQLVLLNTRGKHPEAKHHQRAGGAHMDTE